MKNLLKYILGKVNYCKLFHTSYKVNKESPNLYKCPKCNWILWRSTWRNETGPM